MICPRLRLLGVQGERHGGSLSECWGCGGRQTERRATYGSSCSVHDDASRRLPKRLPRVRTHYTAYTGSAPTVLCAMSLERAWALQTLASSNAIFAVYFRSPSAFFTLLEVLLVTATAVALGCWFLVPLDWQRVAATLSLTLSLLTLLRLTYRWHSAKEGA